MDGNTDGAMETIMQRLIGDDPEMQEALRDAVGGGEPFARRPAGHDGPNIVRTLLETLFNVVMLSQRENHLNA